MKSSEKDHLRGSMKIEQERSPMSATSHQEVLSAKKKQNK